MGRFSPSEHEVNKTFAQRRTTFADDLDVPLEELLEAALAAELAPAPVLPGMPRVRRRPPSCLPRNDQDQRAIEEIRQTLSSMFGVPPTTVTLRVKAISGVMYFGSARR